MRDIKFLKRMIWDLEDRFPVNFNAHLNDLGIPDPRIEKLTTPQFLKLFDFYVKQNHVKRFNDKPQYIRDLNTSTNRLINL